MSSHGIECVLSEPAVGTRMCVCVCACVCVYICIHMYTYIYVCMHACMKHVKPCLWRTVCGTHKLKTTTNSHCPPCPHLNTPKHTSTHAEPFCDQDCGGVEWRRQRRRRLWWRRRRGLWWRCRRGVGWRRRRGVERRPRCLGDCPRPANLAARGRAR